MIGLSRTKTVFHDMERLAPHNDTSFYPRSQPHNSISVKIAEVTITERRKHGKHFVMYLTRKIGYSPVEVATHNGISGVKMWVSDIKAHRCQDKKVKAYGVFSLVNLVVNW